MKAKLITEKYSWGILRKIEVGHSFSIIIHPEHWVRMRPEIISKIPGEFKDEQKKTWRYTFSKSSDIIEFRSQSGSDIVTIPLDEFILKFHSQVEVICEIG